MDGGAEGARDATLVVLVVVVVVVVWMMSSRAWQAFVALREQDPRFWWWSGC